MHKDVEAFTTSIGFDVRLYRYDIQGSVAHCRALARVGVLTSREAERIVKALRVIQGEIEAGQFRFSAGDEDIHSAIENRLVKKVGELGEKLHTGRSRNDQIALDIRLYLRDAAGGVLEKLHRFQAVLLALAKRSVDVVMPGYTHLQRGQPVLFAHWALAYLEMFGRDRGRLEDAFKRLDVLPLGSGALAGVNYPFDRERVAKDLGFSRISRNSLDAVSDRDFILEFLSAASLIMMHLSRMGEEMILWSSQEFHFVDLPEGFCTGSSLMPQKKNPDVPELIRAKTGRVYGALFCLLTILKGLPLAYNRDLQEDKEPLFDSVDTLQDSLSMAAGLLEGLRLRKEVLREAASDSSLLATDLADYLVGKGLPFRQAHGIVGRVVRYGLERHRSLPKMSLEELQRFSKRFESDIFGFLTVEKALSRKGLVGGTAPQAVQRQIRQAEKDLLRKPLSEQAGKQIRKSKKVS